MERRPRVIKLKENPFEEQELHTRTLLHMHFVDNYENYFRWTPKWLEVLDLFWRAFEVEEKNDPEGVWSGELKKTAEKIPKIKEFKLPVQIKYGGLEEADKPEWRYKVDISIRPLSDEQWVEVEATEYGEGFRIGNCFFKMQSLGKVLKKVQTKYSRGWSKLCTTIYDEVTIPEIDYERSTPSGISFSVWLPEGLERTNYQILCRQIGGAIRYYIRGVILDSKSIQEGLEEMD